MNAKTQTEKTPEQVAAEAAQAAAHAAEVAKAEKAAAKAAADAAKAEAKAAKDAEKAAKTATKEAAAKAKADAKAAKDAEKAAKAAATESKKAVMQNNVRQRSPESKGGQIWAVCNELSAAANAPTHVQPVLEKCATLGMNPTNVRCEYAAWKKFHGLVGRIAAPAVAEAAPAA